MHELFVCSHYVPFDKIYIDYIYIIYNIYILEDAFYAFRIMITHKDSKRRCDATQDGASAHQQGYLA